MNVFIFPTDDRSGQTSLIYHYTLLGHKVFIPQFGTLGLNWSRIATWPALLYKSSAQPDKRNIEIHGFNRSNVIFGEDYFLQTQSPGMIYEDDVSCEIIDIEKDNPGIDVFHTLRGGEAYLKLYFEIASKHFPNAKWVSSTFNQMSVTPNGYKSRNSAKLIPAPYESHQTENSINLMSLDFEAKLLNAKIENRSRSGFASFNHNFANRQPIDFQLFQAMNANLTNSGFPEVPNFGGNIRTQGADVRFSKENGITGHFETVTPRDAYEMTAGLKAAVHFKETDWGGGVFYYCLNSGTPIVTTERYVKASNSGNYLINGFNSIYVNTPHDAADAIRKISTDDNFSNLLHHRMLEIKKQVFGGNYWSNWEKFLGALV